MNDREKAIQLLQELPDNISLKEIADTLYTVLDLKNRIDNFDESKCISHEDMKKEIEKW